MFLCFLFLCCFFFFFRFFFSFFDNRLNPAHFRRVAKLLHNGAVMNTKFQPHEVHVPFSLQVFMDYNLFGMDFVHLSALKFRQPLPLASNSQPDKVSAANVTKDLVWAMEDPLIDKMSFCELEADCLSHEIMNRHKKKTPQAHGGPNQIVSSLAGIWEVRPHTCISSLFSPLVNSSFLLLG